MREDKINYTCDDCKDICAVFRSVDEARRAGWGLARDNVMCWCPECAPAHRLGGANGKRTVRASTPRSWLPKGFEQLKIEV